MACVEIDRFIEKTPNIDEGLFLFGHEWERVNLRIPRVKIIWKYKRPFRMHRARCKTEAGDVSVMT